MPPLEASEFILNKDGSIYHLNLLPENIAPCIILVGDPERVERVTKHFDKVEFIVRKREFHTQTGYYKGKRMTVISTGIGTDNIDIVINELDALVNIDFQTRMIKEKHTRLDLTRIGTSGSLQPEIPADAFLLSELSVGFDSLLHFYERDKKLHHELEEALHLHLQLSDSKSKPYITSCNPDLASKFLDDAVFKGFTATNEGFYGPQGRVLRLRLQDEGLNERIESFNYRGLKITNMEMETSGIYGLAQLLGHRAVSMNAIIANRATGEFSANPVKTVDELIKFTLERLADH